MENEKEAVISLSLNTTFLEKVFFAVISIVSFFVPFVLGGPQWLVGTVVNACLFLLALSLPKKYFFPIAILPSLGVLSRGLVFGPFTVFLAYFLPFIWFSNLILIFVFRFLKNKHILAVVIASVAKFVFLLLSAFLYIKLSIVPAVFLQTMGLNQLATAIAGGLVSFLIYKFYTKYARKFNA